MFMQCFVIFILVKFRTRNHKQNQYEETIFAKQISPCNLSPDLKATVTLGTFLRTAVWPQRVQRMKFSTLPNNEIPAACCPKMINGQLQQPSVGRNELSVPPPKHFRNKWNVYTVTTHKGQVNQPLKNAQVISKVQFLQWALIPPCDHDYLWYTFTV